MVIHVFIGKRSFKFGEHCARCLEHEHSARTQFYAMRTDQGWQSMVLISTLRHGFKSNSCVEIQFQPFNSNLACVQHFEQNKWYCLKNVPFYDVTKSFTIPKDVNFGEEKKKKQLLISKINILYLCTRRASTASIASVTALLRAGMPGCSSSCSRVNLRLQTMTSQLLENLTKILKERKL